MNATEEAAAGMSPAVRELACRVAVVDAAVPVLAAGEEGAGQEAAARALAAAWLCLEPREGTPCGACSACHALTRSSCADLLTVSAFGPGSRLRKFQIVPADPPKNLPPERQLPSISRHLRTGPVQAKRKVVVVEHAERLNLDAGNALLRILEEPPEWAALVLTTSAASRILPTVRSRCLLLPCDFGPQIEGDLAAVLAGGAPELAGRLRGDECSPFMALFEAWAAKWPSFAQANALRASELFQELAQSYASAQGDDDASDGRLQRADFIRLFGNWCMSRARSGDVKAADCLPEVIEMHAAVLGNVRFGYLADALFALALPV